LIIRLPEIIARFELVYSLIARYRKILGDATKWIYRDLGLDAAKVNWFYPRGLDQVAKNIPGQPFSAEEIMMNFTAYPLVQWFLPEADAKRLVNHMLGCGDNYVRDPYYGQYYLWAQRMRYCPVCREAEEREFDNAGWHLIHQLRAVHLCAKHAVPLIKAPLHRAFTGGIAKVFLTPGETGPGTTLSVDDSHAEAHLRLAAFFEELLEVSTETPPTGGNIVSKLRSELIRLGYITPNGRIWLSKLKNAMVESFGENYLKKHLTTKRKVKIESLLRNLIQEKHRAANPVLFACVMVALFIPLRTILTAKNPPLTEEEDRPSLRCRNPFCKYFGQSRRGGDTVWKKSKGTLRGSFRCSACLHTYSSSIEKPDRIYVKEYGGVFEQEVIHLHQTSQSLNSIARKGSVSVCTIQRILARNGLYSGILDHGHLEEKRLEIRRRIGHILQERAGISRSELRDIDGSAYSWCRNYDREWLDERLKQRYGYRPVYPKQDDSELIRDGHRKVIQEAIAIDQDLKRCETTGCVANAMRWCRQNDSAWLKEQLPSAFDPLRLGRVANRHTQEDDRILDQKLAEDIRKASETTKEHKGKPVRVTQAHLWRTLHTHVISNKSKLERLPETKKALSECLESVSNFQIRRLPYYAKNMWWGGERITMPKLLMRAGINRERLLPEVTAFIEANSKWLLNPVEMERYFSEEKRKGDGGNGEKTDGD